MKKTILAICAFTTLSSNAQNFYMNYAGTVTKAYSSDSKICGINSDKFFSDSPLHVLGVNMRRPNHANYHGLVFIDSKTLKEKFRIMGTKVQERGMERMSSFTYMFTSGGASLTPAINDDSLPLKLTFSDGVVVEQCKIELRFINNTTDADGKKTDQREFVLCNGVYMDEYNDNDRANKICPFHG